jgi:hypothetical protein
MDFNMPSNELTRFFGEQSAAIQNIHQAINDADLVRIATAYFEASGYQALNIPQYCPIGHIQRSLKLVDVQYRAL